MQKPYKSNKNATIFLHIIRSFYEETLAFFYYARLANASYAADKRLCPCAKE